MRTSIPWAAWHFASGRYIYTSSVYINEIVRIDTSTLQVVGRAVMQNCLGAVRVVPTPTDGRSLIVNCADNGRVLVADAETLRVRHNIVVGTWQLASPCRTTVLRVANMLDDTISIIDVSRGAVRRTIAAGDDPDGIVFVPN